VYGNHGGFVLAFLTVRSPCHGPPVTRFGASRSAAAARFSDSELAKTNRRNNLPESLRYPVPELAIERKKSRRTSPALRQSTPQSASSVPRQITGEKHNAPTMRKGETGGDNAILAIMTCSISLALYLFFLFVD
jgi:hypothetical protein